MKRDFVVPIALGLLAGLAAYWWAPEEISLPEPELPDVPDGSPYVLLPAASADGDPSTLLHMGEPRHGMSSIMDIHGGRVHDGAWSWNGSDLVCLRGGDCLAGEATIPLAPGGNGTFNASRPAEVTFYIFTSRGHLLSTNAPISQWADYELDGDFTQIKGRHWYFGEGRAPAGSDQVPAFRAEARDILDGVPVGAVRSVLLEEHEYDWLVGPIWVTLRIDGV